MNVHPFVEIRFERENRDIPSGRQTVSKGVRLVLPGDLNQENPEIEYTEELFDDRGRRKVTWGLQDPSSVQGWSVDQRLGVAIKSASGKMFE